MTCGGTNGDIWCFGVPGVAEGQATYHKIGVNRTPIALFNRYRAAELKLSGQSCALVTEPAATGLFVRLE